MPAHAGSIFFFGSGILYIEPPRNASSGMLLNGGDFLSSNLCLYPSFGTSGPTDTFRQYKTPVATIFQSNMAS